MTSPNVIALDIDVLWTGREARHPKAVQGLRYLLKHGYELCWITNDTHDYVRRAEAAMKIKQDCIILTTMLRLMLERQRETVYDIGKVCCVVGVRRYDHMEPFMRCLPCESYTMYEGEKSVMFLAPPTMLVKDES